jgi:hypothetical protein
VIPYSAASDAAGNLFVAVETQASPRHWVVLKFGRTGKRLWKKSYGSGETPYGMVVDHDGSVIVAGTSTGAGGYDAAVVKWSSSGRFKWQKTVSSAGLDLVTAVAVDANDNVYAAGDSENAGSGKAVLRSWTSAGRRRWAATATTPLGGMPAWRYIAIKGTSLYVAGQSTGISASSRFMAMKYTTAGKRAWSGIKQLANANGAWVEDLAVDRAGAAVIVGYSYDSGPSGEDQGVVWKLTAKGVTSWSHAFANAAWPHDGEFDSVGVDSKNRIYAAGGQWVTGGTGNLLIVRYSPSGAEQALWRSDGQQSGYCVFSHLLVLSDTQVVAAGKVAGNGSNAAVYRAGTTAP